MSPGTADDTDVLTTGMVTFDSGSYFAVRINGDYAAWDYDQLHASAIAGLNNAALVTSGTRSWRGDQPIVLIQNDDTDPIPESYQFNDLDEGDTVTINGFAYTITYCYNAESGTLMAETTWHFAT